MSSYRCPLCGANHKDTAERCRLCGQSLAPGTVATAPPRATAPPPRAQRGIKGVVLIGVGLVAALIAGAVLFGLLQNDRQVQKAKDLVTGVADGWTPQAEPEGRFVVDMPGVRTRAATAFAGATDGNLTAWQASVGDDTEVLVGWAKVTPPMSNGKITDAAAIQWLQDTVLQQWADTNHAVNDSEAKGEEAYVGGLPAVSLHSTRPAFLVKGKEAFGHVALVLRHDTLYVIQVLSIYKEQTQLGRMAASFVPTA
jgi:hypothetical protein